MSGPKPIRIKSVDVVEAEAAGDEDYIVVYFSKEIDGRISTATFDVSDLFDLATNFGKLDTIPDGKKEEPVIAVDCAEVFGKDEDDEDEDAEKLLGDDEDDGDDALDADFKVKEG